MTEFGFNALAFLFLFFFPIPSFVIFLRMLPI